MVSQQLPCCRAEGIQMWIGPEYPDKGPGARPLVLPWCIVVDLDLRYLKIELKVLVGFLFCNLIVCLPYTVSDNVEIRIVATWSRSFPCSGNGKIKNPLEVSKFLESCDLFLKVWSVFFKFTETFFCVACNDLDHVPMKGLGSQPLRIHL